MNKIFEFCARHSAKLTVGLLVLMVAFHFVFTSSYVLRIAITVLMYIVLSLSLNLSRQDRTGSSLAGSLLLQ